jgi:MYXO-CTERM domain-containing protein
MAGHTFVDPIFNVLTGGAAGPYVLNGNGTLTGASLSESGQGQLDVKNDFGSVGVYNYLNGDKIPDNLGGFADVVVTSSTNNLVLNPFDLLSPLADSCLGGTPQPGDWCLQGTLNTRGTTVAEPTSMALAGLALVGLGAIRRRKQNLV